MLENITVLIIDDSVEVIRTLSEMLKSEYKVFFSIDGQKGIDLAKKKKPDIILLDIIMEPIDGYEVCRQLKADPATSDIPIIFVTASSETNDEAKGFEIGGADYITKPFVPVVALARIHHHAQSSTNMKELKRLYSLALDANPITTLPGNNSIHTHIDTLLREKKAYYILYCDLDNFKAYNDYYGFAKGDEVILETATLFSRVAQEMNINNFFVGHIGGDDFVVAIESDGGEKYVSEYLKSFDKMIKNHYNIDDLDIGFIISKNRFGDVVKYPLISISIAGVDISSGNYKSYLEISDSCTEMKHRVKKLEGSNFILDKRKKF